MSPLNAQGDSFFSCGTQFDSNFDYSIAIQTALNNPTPTSTLIPTISIRIILITEDDGTYYPFENASLGEQIAYANDLFSSIMSFNVCEIVIINNSEWYDLETSAELLEVYNYDNIDNAINVYYANSLFTGVGGLAYPAQNNNGVNNRVYLRHSVPEYVLTHELGHYFGLLHTFGNCDYTNSPTFVCPPELVDGSNCETAGDFICDTPADPATLGASIPMTVCPHPTSLSCDDFDCSSILDFNGDAYEPEPRNIMSYYHYCESRHFSTEQLAVMNDILLTDDDRYPLLTPPNCPLEVTGNIEVYCELDGNSPLEGQKVRITTSESCSTETDVNGNYQVNQICPLGFNLGEDINFTVAPKLFDLTLPYHYNHPGVTAMDLFLISQHLSTGTILNTPYKLIAADADNNGVVNSFDIQDIQQVILGLELFFYIGIAEGAAWRFVPHFYLNSDANFNSNFFNNPFTAVWMNSAGVVNSYIDNPFTFGGSYMDQFSGNLQNPSLSNNDNWSFRAIKIGDVNCNATQSPYFNFGPTEPAALARESGVKINTIENYGNSCLEKGKKGKILFSLSSEEDLSSYQLGVSINNKKIKVNKVQREDDKSFSLDRFNQEDLMKGNLKTLWWNENGKASSFSKEKILFSIEIEALEDFCDLTDLIKVNWEVLPSWFYNIEGNPIEANLFVELSSDFLVDRKNLDVEVYPNPSTNQFTFEFEVEKEEEAILTIYDYFGNAIEQKIVLTKGKQTILIEDTSKLSHGLLYYQLSVNNKMAQGKIIKLK